MPESIKHTAQHLKELQSLPLDLKIRLTKQRIREWINYYGEDGVYVSFSGGKDSTVLLNIVRDDYPDVPAVFVDTGLEYPEIREFVKTFDNVVWLKPKKNFRQVIQDYGYPFISKEVSERVYYAQKYLTFWKEKNGYDKSPSDYALKDLLGLRTCENDDYKKIIVPDDVIMEFIETNGKGTYKLKQLYGLMKTKDGKPSQFNYSKWKWLASCPYKISNKCCDIMKKAPIHRYQKETGRWGITAMMASESRLRFHKWLQNGCNAFNVKQPISNPMSFWTEQDVLRYIYVNKTPIASVYGKVVKENNVDGQYDFEDLGIFELKDHDIPILKTTGCKRTGCMFCGFGTQFKENENRFEVLKETHPIIYNYIMKSWSEGGLGYKDVIDWLNKNGKLSIRY